LKCGKYLVSGICNQIHKGPTNNKNKLDATNDLWEKMNTLSDVINMNKEERENVLAFFIECCLQELQNVSEKESTDKDAGNLQAVEFFVLDLWDAMNMVLFEKNINKTFMRIVKK
jgi:hypothetical protein